MAPTKPKTVVVMGASGNQGGSIARELLSHGERYHIRALTRDPSSPNCQALAELGAELCRADINDPDSLQSAFNGAHIIYAMTDFWQTQSAEIEFAQGQAITDLADQVSTLEHFVWSALPDPERLSNGQMKNILHWKSKSRVTEYIQKSKPALWAKTTTILFPNYFENSIRKPGRYLPRKTEKGNFVYPFPHSPDTVMPNVSIEDTGKLVRHVVEGSSAYHGKTIAFYSQAISEAEKMKQLGQFYNIDIQYRHINAAEFEQELRQVMSPAVALDYTEQLLIFEKHGNVYARKEFVQANQIQGLKLKTWDDFLQSHDLLSLFTVE